MSQTIDTKVVEMRFDNSNFEKNVEVCLSSLKNLNKGLDDAGKNRNSLDGLAQAGDRVGISFDNMESKARISLNVFDMLAGVGTRAFNKISDAVAGFALNMANSLSDMQAMRDGFNEYELKMGSVQTILAGAKIIDPQTGKELKEEGDRLKIVNEQLKELNDYSDKTIYSFKDMTANIGKFTNAGVDLKTSVQAIQGVANVAAISGANAGEASRAMYNFSQALSSGAVKLIDWKSIENANMATVGFKQQLLDTAQALKTVTKDGDMYLATTDKAAGKTRDAFNATKMFNDSLSDQWMTTEVLTQTLKNYSTDVRYMADEDLKTYKDSLLEIGYTAEQVENIIETSKKAFEAATEVKTFSQMIDTLKESLGSGWAETFELIIGDFSEAKKLFTGLNGAIESILSPIGEVRNAILRTWKDNGGRDALINSFSNLFFAVKNLLAPIKELWKALTPSTDTTGKALANIFKAFEKGTAIIRKSATAIGKVMAIFLKPFMLIAGVVGTAVSKTFKIIGSVFSKIVNVFRPATKTISEFTDKLSKAFDNKVVASVKYFGSSLAKIFDDLKARIAGNSAIQKLVESFASLKDVLKNLVLDGLIHLGGIASKISGYFSTLWNAISPFISSAVMNVLSTLSKTMLPKVQSGLEYIVNAIDSLGKSLKNINLKDFDLLSKFEGVGTRVKEAFSKIDLKSSPLYSSLSEFGTKAVDVLTEKFESLKSTVESISMPKGLSEMLNGIKEFISGIFGKESVGEQMEGPLEAMGGNALDESGAKLTLFQKFVEGVTTALELMAGAAYLALNAIKDFAGYVKKNIPTAFTAIKTFFGGDDGVVTIEDFTGAISLLGMTISQVMSSIGIKAGGEALKGVTTSFGDLTTATTDFIKKCSNRMNTESIKSFAIALGILAFSIALLAQIPTDKLGAATLALIAIGAAFTWAFGQISKSSMKLNETAGAIPIAILIGSIGAAMLAFSFSLGVLVGALALFPRVIKQYNNLGDDFRTGMDRVKEVLAEIFEYMSSLSNAKYGFKGAAALMALVYSIDKIRKIIIKYAGPKTGEAMAEGLDRIKEVLDLLGGFLNSITIASFTGVNIGINFNTLGIAAMIWALGNMIKTITPQLQELSKLSPTEFSTAFNALTLILAEVAGFMFVMATIQNTMSGSLGKWIGMAATITLLGNTIGTITNSLNTMVGMIQTDATAFIGAMVALTFILIELAGVLYIIGKMDNSTAPLFALTTLLGAVTLCIMAMSPIAMAKPGALIVSVIALGLLMVALAGSLYLMKMASGEVGIKDIIVLITISGLMFVLTTALTRMAKMANAGSIVAAGAAIAGAMISLGAAIKLMNGAVVNPTVLIALAIITAAIWGIVFAIRAFKGSAGEMSEASTNVGASMEQVGETAKTSLFDAIKNIEWGELFGNIDFGAAFKDFDLGKWIRASVEKVKQDARNWAQDFIDIGTNLMDGITVALSNESNIVKVRECIVAVAKAMWEAFKTFFQFGSPSKKMEEAGNFIIDGLVQGLMNFPGKIGEWVTGIGQMIKDGIGDFIDGAKEKGSELVASIGEGIQNGKETVKRKVSELGSAAIKKLDKANEWGKKATKSANAFGQKLASSKGRIKSTAGNMILGATKVVQDTQLVFGKSAMSAVTKYVSEIRNGKSKASAAGSALLAGAKTAFHGITSTFASYGRNVGQGFINGMSRMLSSIKEKARALISGAKEAAKNEAGIQSPSKVFAELGYWTAQGYAVGLGNRKSLRSIEDNARKMIGAATDAVSSSRLTFAGITMDSNSGLGSLATAINKISEALDDSIDTNPTIRPVIDMSNVNRSASDIASLFNSNTINAGLNAAMSIIDNYEAAKNNDPMENSIRSLTKQLSAVTDTMNSRSLNNYISIDGAANPESFANELIRSFKLNARTV